MCFRQHWCCGMLKGVFKRGGSWSLKCVNLQWGSRRSRCGRGCFWNVFSCWSFIFTEHLLGLVFLLTVFGECWCRKSISEWGKRLNFSFCPFTRFKLFVWLLLHCWSLGCEYTLQGSGFGTFKSNKSDNNFPDTWNGKTLYSKSSFLYSFYKSEVVHSLFLT